MYNIILNYLISWCEGEGLNKAVEKVCSAVHEPYDWTHSVSLVACKSQQCSRRVPLCCAIVDTREGGHTLSGREGLEYDDPTIGKVCGESLCLETLLLRGLAGLYDRTVPLN